MYCEQAKEVIPKTDLRELLKTLLKQRALERTLRRHSSILFLRTPNGAPATTEFNVRYSG